MDFSTTTPHPHRKAHRIASPFFYSPDLKFHTRSDLAPAPTGAPKTPARSLEAVWGQGEGGGHRALSGRSTAEERSRAPLPLPIHTRCVFRINLGVAAPWLWPKTCSMCWIKPSWFLRKEPCRRGPCETTPLAAPGHKGRVAAASVEAFCSDGAILISR